MALRGERFVAMAIDAVTGPKRRTRIEHQAAEYWEDPDHYLWEANSHWREGIGEDAWHEVGRDHWAIFETFARSLQSSLRLGTVVEWGCGGGANAVAFAPRAERFVGADISDASLAECARQVGEVCDTPVETRRIDLERPEAAAAGLDGSSSTFLCLYVIEVTTGPDEVRRILRIAERVLAPGGLAFVQMKYHTTDGRTRGRPGVRYERNLALTTTFTIDEFWSLAGECGLEPKLVTLVPKNRLDERYAYYAMVKP
jgi:SAM-dependent methyltransferase